MEYSERFQFFKHELERLVLVDMFEKPYGQTVIHYAFEENGPIVAVFEGKIKDAEDESGLLDMGKLSFTNGMSYDGTWYDDLPNQGFYKGDGGIFEFADGIVFEGKVDEGLPNGHGWIHLPNGKSIWADWYDGVPRNVTHVDSNGKEVEEQLDDDVEEQNKDLDDAWKEAEYKELYAPEEEDEYDELYAPEKVMPSGRVEACQEMNQRVGSLAVSMLRCRLGKKTVRKTRRSKKVRRNVRRSKRNVRRSKKRQTKK